MKTQKLKRGEYGYLQQRKQGAMKGMLGMVLLGVAIFGVGLLLNKMEATNVFTVVAICMVMPAAKHLVNVIILSPYHPMTPETKERLDSYARDKDTVLYDVVFSSAEKIMHLDCIYVTGHQVIGYTARKKDDIRVIQEYFKKELEIRGISFAVYIATEEKQVKDRMKLRGEEHAANEAEVQEVLEMLRVFTI